MSVERRGNLRAVAFQPSLDLDSDGNGVARRFLGDLLDGSGQTRQQLAAAVGMSEGYLSKVLSGRQGDLLALLYHPRFPRAVRSAWHAGMAEADGVDPVATAAEHVAVAALRFLRVRAGPLKMSLEETRKAAAGTAASARKEGTTND